MTTVMKMEFLKGLEVDSVDVAVGCAEFVSEFVSEFQSASQTGVVVSAQSEQGGSVAVAVSSLVPLPHDVPS